MTESKRSLTATRRGVEFVGELGSVDVVLKGGMAAFGLPAGSRDVVPSLVGMAVTKSWRVSEACIGLSRVRFDRVAGEAGVREDHHLGDVVVGRLLIAESCVGAKGAHRTRWPGAIRVR